MATLHKGRACLLSPRFLLVVALPAFEWHSRPSSGTPGFCHLPSTVANASGALVPRFQAPHSRGKGPFWLGPRGPGPSLLLFLDSGILSSISFQTLGDHSALSEIPGAGQRSPRRRSRAGPPSWGEAGLQTAAFCGKAGTCGGLMLCNCSLPDADAEEVTQTFASSHSRGSCFTCRASFWRGSVSKIYDYTHQGLRYWMILYKLLKCFSAQLVA